MSIIRLSGSAAISIAGRLFRRGAPPPQPPPIAASNNGAIQARGQPSVSHGHSNCAALAQPPQPQATGAGFDPESHRVYYGHVRDWPGGALLDEVLLLPMRAPRSFTKEDVVELHCHGGGVTARRVLDAALAAGARLARPGEFTMRAFLRGRLDLPAAEAVAALVAARTPAAADAALAGLTVRPMFTCCMRMQAKCLCPASMYLSIVSAMRARQVLPLQLDDMAVSHWTLATFVMPPPPGSLRKSSQCADAAPPVQGGVGGEVAQLQAAVVALLATIEAQLDFSDDLGEADTDTLQVRALWELRGLRPWTREREPTMQAACLHARCSKHCGCIWPCVRMGAHRHTGTVPGCCPAVCF